MVESDGHNEEPRKGKCRLCVVRHDGKELLLVDFAILVEVKLINHGLSRGDH